MTAEVAIINREAIALAADSAVSVRMLDGTKIYNSANKLFALSQYYPVGVMIYGSAKLTGVPWETLIKVYRKKLGSKKFPRLSDYCNDFLNYLSASECFFRDEDQLENIKFIVGSQFDFIKQEIREKIRKVITEKVEIGEKLRKSEEGKIIDQVIGEVAKKLKDREVLNVFSDVFIRDLSKKYHDVFIELVKDVFEELKLKERAKKQLTEIAVDILTKDIFSSGYSGIVIAGFGEEEVFPDLQTYNVGHWTQKR